MSVGRSSTQQRGCIRPTTPPFNRGADAGTFRAIENAARALRLNARACRRSARALVAAACIAVTPVVAGCSGKGRPPEARADAAVIAAGGALAAEPATRPADPSLVVVHDDFEALWQACEDAMHARQFRVDRRDFRNGVLTSEPTVSKQFFEVWRRDALGAEDVAESSLATVRRTVRFDITRRDDGRFQAVPSVLVERYSNAGRRLTSAAMYRSAFRRTEAYGTPETDRGVRLPSRYWYEVGNDEAVETALARAVEKKLS